jgi:hypothetical protein
MFRKNEYLWRFDPEITINRASFTLDPHRVVNVAYRKG